MIDHITGTICTVSDKGITLTTGPFGLTLGVVNPALFEVGVSQTLYVHMHWNQEQGPSLYGFAHQHERTVFLLVISCSGIGPKIGLAMLSCLGAEGCVRAIHEENPKALAQVPGIGLKKAEQIIVHLKHKVADVPLMNGEVSIAKAGNDWHAVLQALESLNYSRTEISAAVQHVRQKQGDSTASFDVLLRSALSFLAKQL